MMNKKGDVAVTLLVLMIIVLIGYSLFSFTRTLSIRGGVLDAQFVEGSYVNEAEAIFNLRVVGEDAVGQSYLSVVKKASGTNPPSDVYLLLEQEILSRLRASKLDLDYNSLKIKADNEKVVINYPGETTRREANDTEGNSRIVVFYEPNISVVFYYEDYGLTGLKAPLISQA